MSDYKTLVIDDATYETRLTKKYARRKPYAPKDLRRIGAFIPGVIRAVHVAAGDRVRRGQSLLVLEAMKMQNHLAAPLDGLVREVATAPGDSVAKGQVLVAIQGDPDTL